MASEFQFDHRIEFFPENSGEILRSIPAAPSVFALRGADPATEPYLTRTANLRRRLRRLLAPPEAVDDQGRTILSKRLNLRQRVRFIEWQRTGSGFESTLVLYRALRSAFGPEDARRRLRLHSPYLLRMTMSNQHPRAYITNRLSKKSLPESFGPFPSRAAAERYCDAVLDLFQLRRCYEDLEPYPDHPGCVYGEMKKCMQPCKQGNPQACTSDQYAREADRVFAFFATHGQSLLDEIATRREAASSSLDFEAAASLHKQWEKARAASLLAGELVGPVADLRALILQEAAPHDPAASAGPGTSADLATTTDLSAPAPGASTSALAHRGGDSALEPWISTDSCRTEDVAAFLFQSGRIIGPERLSTLGVRAVREQTAVGSSLFAQPLMLAPVPLLAPAALDEPTQTTNSLIFNEGRAEVPNGRPLPTEVEAPESKNRVEPKAAHPAQATSSLLTASLTPEDRARAAVEALSARAYPFTDIAEFCDNLSLFRRWYCRPEKQRTGEIFLPNPDGSWPIRRILNGAARIVLGPPTPAPVVDPTETHEGAKALKTKIIHAGREGVEREVPVLPKRSRTRKAVTPSDTSE